MDYTPSEKAAITRALNIIAERHPENSDVTLDSPGASRDLFTLHLAKEDAGREHFAVAFLNTQHRLLSIETIFSGTIDGAAVYPREIARRCLETGAAAVILGHNHPSGLASPSSADKRITTRIRDALALLDIRTLDHIITTPGNRDISSMAEQGLL